MKLFPNTVLLLAIVVLAASPASAYIINLTTNTPVFYDNFENQPADKISHAAYPNDMDAFPVSPVLYGGWWTDLNAANNVARQKQVTDYNIDTPIGPGAYVGSNYFRMARRSTAPDNNFVMICQNFDSSKFTAGDTFHWEQMLYVSATGGNSFFARFITENHSWMSANNPEPIIEIKVNGANLDNHVNNAAITTPGMTFTYGAWHKLEVDYVLGEETYVFSFDGTKATLPINLTKYKDELPSFVAMRAGPNSSLAYLDEPFAIPEPSTFALLGMGLLGLLAYAWRKRK